MKPDPTRSVWTWTALTCAVLLVVSVYSAQAGINVWTSLGLEGVYVSALAIDPSKPSTLYVGTPTCNPFCTGGGVLKSSDGGGTWNATGLGDVDATSGSTLVIDPVTPTTLYAGTYGGDVFKTTDGGDTWNVTSLSTSDGHPDAVLSALAIDPTTPTTLYAGVYDVGVFKSTDAGGTWSATALTFPAGGDPDGVFAYSVYALAIDPATLYACVGYGRGILKSTDGGTTWSASGLPSCVLAFDPATPATLYAGGGGVFKSTDGGTTWSASGLPNAVVSALAIDPSAPATLYAGGALPYGGNGVVFKSTDGAMSWQAINAGLPPNSNANVIALAIDPTTPTTLYAGTFYDGVFAIQQAPAATPTPTPTATPAATLTPATGAGASGCTLSGGEVAGSWLFCALNLMVALLVVRAFERRSMSSGVLRHIERDRTGPGAIEKSRQRET